MVANAEIRSPPSSLVTSRNDPDSRNLPSEHSFVLSAAGSSDRSGQRAVAVKLPDVPETNEDKPQLDRKDKVRHRDDDARSDMPVDKEDSAVDTTARILPRLALGNVALARSGHSDSTLRAASWH